MKYLPLISLLSLLLTACTDSADHSQNSSLSPDEEAALIERGMDIQKATFAALSSELNQQISKGGFVQAIDYCQTRALPLTDSMATLHDVRLRRVSNRPRNPDNLATVAERTAMQEYNQVLLKDPGAELKPRVRVEGDRVYYYGPIRMQGLCINCHGDPDRDIANEVMTQITQRYPHDRATGYKLNDLRGMWSIRLKL